MTTDDFRELLRNFVEQGRTDRNNANATAKLLAKIVKSGDEIIRNMDKLNQIGKAGEDIV